MVPFHSVFFPSGGFLGVADQSSQKQTLGEYFKLREMNSHSDTFYLGLLFTRQKQIILIRNLQIPFITFFVWHDLFFFEGDSRTMYGSRNWGKHLKHAADWATTAACLADRWSLCCADYIPEGFHLAVSKMSAFLFFAAVNCDEHPLNMVASLWICFCPSVTVVRDASRQLPRKWCIVCIS